MNDLFVRRAAWRRWWSVALGTSATLSIALYTSAELAFAGEATTNRVTGVAHQQRASQQPAQPRKAGVTWTFQDIDIQTLLGRLKRFGVEAPVPLEGRVTVRLSLDVPWRSVLRPGSYEMEGDLSSPALKVAGVELQSISVHMLYTEGAFQLSKMSFTVPGERGAAGSVSGTARMQVRPRGDLTAQLDIARIPLAPLFDALPGLAGQVSGTTTGRFGGQVPVDRLRDPTAWQAQGHLTLNDAQALGLPPLSVTTDLRLAAGRATLTNLTAEFERARVTASGNLALAAPYDFTLRMRAAIPDLKWLDKLNADLRPPVAVAGNFGLSAEADGSLQAKRVRIRGTIDGRHLQAGPIVIDRLLVPYDGTLERVRLNSVRADLYGGRITANFNLPTELEGNIGVGVRMTNVDLGALASATLEQHQDWRGLASGTLQLQAPAARIADLDTWSGQGDLSLGEATLLGIDVSQVAANVRIDRGELAVNRLSVESTLGRVTGSARLNLTTPFGFGTALRVENVNLARLNDLPESLRPPVRVAGRAGISTRVQGTLQPLQLSLKGGVATRGLGAENVVFDTLDLKYTAESGDEPTKLASWQAQLNAKWNGAHVERANLPGGSVDARLAKGIVEVSRFASEGNSMRVTGSASVGLLAPHDFALKLAAENVDVALANGLPIRPPVQVSGAASLSADVQGKLAPLEIDGNGKFQARNLRIAGAAIDSLGFDFAGDNTNVTLSHLALTAYRGRLDGKVIVPLARAEQGDLDLHWQQIRVGRAVTDLRGFLAGALGNSAGADGGREATGLSRLSEALSDASFDGWTWGRVRVHTPADKLLDPAAWTGDVDVSLAEMRFFDWSIKKAFVRGRLADGKAELTRLAFDVNQAKLRGTASLELAEPYNFRSNVSLDGVDLADFNKLPSEVRPPVKLAGGVRLTVEGAGTLEPLEIAGQGSLTGEQLEADGAKVDHLLVQFDAERRRLKLTRFQADLYGGTIDGTAQIALAGDEAGKIDFAWKEIDVGQFVTDVARLPVLLKGKVSGKLAIQIPAGKLSDVAAWTVDAAFDTTPITAESASLGQFSGRLSYRRGLLDYGLKGSLLRGRLDVAGRWQPRGGKSAVNEGHIEITAIRLDALLPFFRTGSMLGSLSGQISANVPYRHDEKSGLPQGAGDLAIDDVRLNEVSLLDEVRGLVRVAGDRLEIANLQGLVAEGSLTASAVAFFDPTRRGSFRLDIDGADLAQAAAPWHGLAAKVRGTLDGQLQGFFGGRRPMQVAGAMSVRHGRVAGFEFSGLRLPLAGTFDPGSGHAAIQLRGISGQIALGHFVGDVDLTLANGLDLKGHGKFNRVDLRTLLRQSATASRMANGKVDGVYTLAGRNVRSAADLTGTLKADLTRAQALALPVLAQIIPYLTGGVSGSTTFDDGEIRAHLSRGVVRVDRFTLSSGSVQIYADGTASLAGRLDLNVIAKTGQLNARAQAVAMLASRIALVVSPPVGLLLEVTQFLSNQVINLEVTGTVRSPTVRIQPLQLLGQEAARFFLYQAIP